MKNDEHTNKLVIEVAKLLQVEVAPKHISTSHCLPTMPNRNSEKIHFSLTLQLVMYVGISAAAYTPTRN